MAFSPTFQYQSLNLRMVRTPGHLYEEPVSCSLGVKHLLSATSSADKLGVNEVNRGEVGVHVKPFVEL